MKLQRSIAIQGIVALTVIGLSGCGGGNESNNDDSSPVPPSPVVPVTYKATDAIRSAQLQKEFYLDLSQNMSSSDGSAAKLLNVTPLNSIHSCEPISVDSSGFLISADSAKVCDYTFEVGEELKATALSDSANVNANIRALVGESVTLLPPISVTTTTETPVTLDLVSQLSFIGYSVDTRKFQLSEEVSLPYGAQSSSLTTVSSASNEITYEPGLGFTGIERILFSYSDGVNVLSGTIDVSVSSEANNAPIAESFEYRDPTTGSQMVASGLPVSIDVTPFISDSDNDSLKIEDIYSYDSTLSITGDTTFEFSSAVLGKQYVTYVITDGKKGYSSGTVSVTIEPDMSLIQDWENIVYFDSSISSDITFTAPASRAYADYVGFNYSDYFTGKGEDAPQNSQYVGFSFEQAKELCKKQGGRLPTEREFLALISAKSNLFSSDNWPASIVYWVDEHSSNLMARTVDATSGTTADKSIESVSLATCVLYDSAAVTGFTITNKAVDIVDGHTVITGTLLNPDGNAALYKKLDIELLDEFKGDLRSNTLVTDGNGEFSIKYADFSFEPNAYVASVYRIIEKSLIPVDRSLFLLPLIEEDQWNRLAIKNIYNADSDLAPVTENGMPLLRNDSQNTNVYKGKSYTGDEVIAEMSTYTPGVAISGKYSFFIQQVGVVPDSTWGSNNLQPGAPNSSSAFSVVINIWSEKVDIFSGYGELLATYKNIDLSGSRKVWFEVRKGVFSLYTSKSGNKPELPLIVENMDWSTIDTRSGYWIGLGAFNADQTDGTELDARELLVRTFLN